MTGKKMAVEEWLTKASWEGGVLEAISSYGLSHKNLDPTEDSEIYETIKRISKKLDSISDDLELLEERMEGYEI